VRAGLLVARLCVRKKMESTIPCTAVSWRWNIT
jgi:hypothetical protein